MRFARYRISVSTCICLLMLAFAPLLPAQEGGDQQKQWQELNARVGQLYKEGKYSQAEPVSKEALQLAEAVFGSEHSFVADALSNLALLYYAQGKYAEVEPLHRRSLGLGLAIAAEAQVVVRRGPPPRATATTLLKLSPNAAGELIATTPFSLRLSTSASRRAEFAIKLQPGGLHIVCTWQPSTPLQISLTVAAGHGLPGRVGLASQIGQSPITIEVQVTPEQVARGPVYVEVYRSPFQQSGTGMVRGTIVASLMAGVAKELGVQVSTEQNPQEKRWQGLTAPADELFKQGKYSDAESVAKEALQLAEVAFGPEHPAVAQSLSNLALLYQAQGKYAEAEPLYRRSLAIREKVLGPEHPDVAQSLNNLAELYRAQGKYAEAEPLLLARCSTCCCGRRALLPRVLPHCALALQPALMRRPWPCSNSSAPRSPNCPNC